MQRNVPVHEETLSRCRSPGFPVAAFRSWEDTFQGAGGGHNRSPMLFLVLVLREGKKDDVLEIPTPHTPWC